MTNTSSCPCGSLYIPAGSKHKNGGLSTRLFYSDMEYIDLKLVHTSDSFLSNEQIFVTTTEEIQLNQNINIQKIVLFCDNTYNLIINNSINIVIKDFNTKDVLFTKVFGAIDDSIPFSSNIINNKIALVIENPCSTVDRNFYNNRFQIEIHSICDIYNEALCCNDNQISFTLDDQNNNLNLDCCMTIDPPPPSGLGICCVRGWRANPSTQQLESYAECLGIMSEVECDPISIPDAERIWIPSGTCDFCVSQPFCDSFNFPNSFRITVVGFGTFDGQEKESIVYKNGDVYQTSGTFPCGAFFYLSMICDPVEEVFSYDGYISCCDESTKWVHDETKYPLIVPNTKTPQIIGYKTCNSCFDCTTTTTTTTQIPLPCDDSTITSVTINGYAFYRTNRGNVTIPGIGEIPCPCFGSHVCDRTDFLPQLILPSKTIDGQPFNVNNSPAGGDRDATFSFSLPDIRLLQNGASINLKCLSNSSYGCHSNVTFVVLTLQINNQTTLIFRSCVFPDETIPIDLSCPCEDNICSITPSGSSIQNEQTQEHLLDLCQRAITLTYQAGPITDPPGNPVTSVPNKYEIYCSGVIIATTNGWVGGTNYVLNPRYPEYQPIVGGPMGSISGIKPAGFDKITVKVYGNSPSEYVISCD